jgi:hypothetical protein
MHRIVGRWFAIVGVLVALLALAPPRMLAAQASTMRITFERPAGMNLSLSENVSGRLTVLVSGVTCVTIVPTGDRVTVEVGAADQPAPCRQTGAPVTFLDGNGRLLFVATRFIPGTSLTLSNFAPVPPTTGVPPAPPVATGPTPSRTGNAGPMRDGSADRAAPVIALIGAVLVLGACFVVRSDKT